MTKRTEREQATNPTRFPETTPGSGGGFDATIYAMLAEMRGSIGELKSSIESLKGSVDSIKLKVDDLVNWKHRILGGAFVFGIIATVIGAVGGYFWNYVTIKSPLDQTRPAIQQSTTTVPIAPQLPRKP